MKAALIPVNDIPTSGTTAVDFFGREVLVYLDEGKPRAVVNSCLHVGGPLSMQEGKFVCAWHQAEFDCHTGERLAGPSQVNARLMFLPTRIEEGVLHYVWGE